MPYPPLMMLSIQKSPTAKQIQPMGLWGRLEAIRAPTKGKARKGSMKTNTMLKPPVPQVIGGCTDRGRMMYNATFATNMTSARVASDQASQVAARVLIPPTPRLCSLAPSVTTPLYSTTVSKALRQPLRGDLKDYLPAPATTREMVVTPRMWRCAGDKLSHQIQCSQ